MTTDAPSAIAPVEMMLIGFPGNRFDGAILPAMKELIDDGTIRLIDLVMVNKDADGNVSAVEVSELDEDEAAPFADLDGEIGELFSDEDLMLAGEQLEPNSSAALVLWEDSWASKLTGAVGNSGGEVLMYDRIPAAVMADALTTQPDA